MINVVKNNRNLIGIILLTGLIISICLICTFKLSGSIMYKQDKPNIIYIFTDQQHAGMMSCAGNKWLNTPAMDYIAENGIRFTRAYVTNPACAPNKTSFMTGRLPGSFTDNNGNQVRENIGAVRIPEISEEVKQTTIAFFMKEAGYQLIYGGARHLPRSLMPKELGFKDLGDEGRAKTARAAANFIKDKQENPYFMMISLINPHDICLMTRRDFAITEREKRLFVERSSEASDNLDRALQIPDGLSKEVFYKKYCPPLPVNFEPQQDEPEAIKEMIRKTGFQELAREQYTENDWRHHRWAYCRLTELVDKEIQIILDALKESGQEENTLVLFSSDHGDMDAAHRLEHKAVLYEESSNIPFLAMWKGKIPEGQVDSMHLISNGLDLLPTICDYAGIQGLADPRGKSLRPLFEGKSVNWRETLGVESSIGRMVVDKDGFKYIKYDLVGIEEQLIDLNRDPFETGHVTNDIRYKDKLTELQKVFKTKWFPGY